MQNDPVLAQHEGFGSKNKRLVFAVEGGLRYLKGNHAPYFSLTCSGWDHGCEIGGCDHKRILKHFPRFADLAALHLSDIWGVPGYAEANGWYNLAGYFGGAGERYHVGTSKRHFPTESAEELWRTTEYRYPTQAECLQIWADHVRISLVDAERAAAEIAAGWNWPDMKARHAAFIEAQKPRWRQEAEACIAKHGLVVFGDPWSEQVA